MRVALSIAVLAGLVLLASAACPNSCSGHGVCGANDKCACHEQTNTPWGQRKGWTGADCSRRTCPLGVAFDMISTQRNALRQVLFTPSDGDYTRASSINLYLDENFNSNMDLNYIVRIADAEAGTFQWKLDTDTYFSLPIDQPIDLHWAFELQNGTGVRVWFANKQNLANSKAGDTYEFTAYHNHGVDFSAINDNTAHQMQECSGRGMCDRGDGRCSCFDGYEGEACQRVSCRSGCSGHGMCQLETRFASDASSAYTLAYDASKEAGCKCDAGFRGPLCDQIECPSGADPLGFVDESRDCSGRGLCNYATGTCECFKGFTGGRCQTQNNYA